MNKEQSTWKKADWITALIAALISFGVYAWTAAPNVTLLDSGEFVVAAQHFGVPHPTGYPVWTFLTWLFLLLPLGNAAWEVALFSGVCAAIAVGLTAALLSNIQTWVFGEYLGGRMKRLPQFVALSFSLMLAFSQSMWSQAVIAEVYALHALLIGIYLIACYSWVRKPSKDSLMLWAFFFLTLSFSNHQLTMTLVLLPYLLILLLRRRRFLDWLFAGLLTVLLGYLGFAILSKEPPVLKTAIRFFYCVALAFAVFVWIRRFRIQWKLVAFLPIVVAAGLLPHIYMPIASSTNPPMNWGYTREADGFFFSINRSQYPGALTDVTVRSLGKLMGSSPPSQDQEPARPGETGRLEMAQLWVGFFWQQMLKAFTVVGIIGYFGSIIFIFRLPLSKRVWIYFLHVAFLLAAFLQPITANTKTDQADWWTQMPYHTYTNLILAILGGLGTGLIIEKLARRRATAFWLAPALLVLPVFPYLSSEPSSSQRDHLFGWMFGYDMLKDLPKGSIMIGGTDPGRFVPTYMILGESNQPDRFKRDPGFDRRDLYIITQNALGEPNYMKYLRDHYTKDRPQPANAFERWLGRADTYPKDPILLPSEDEIKDIVQKEIKENESRDRKQSPETIIFSSTLKWIWEKNRDKHDFFIEESFPLYWTYDYAIPHGLIYKLNKTKVEKLTPEMVAEDFRFWKEYKAKLLSNPHYREDFDAQRSFSKLRLTMGNIYSYRDMPKEAERAYRDALELWPGNLEAIVAIMGALWEREDFDGALPLFNQVILDDPNNMQMWRLYAMAERRKTTDAEIRQLLAKLKAQPKSRETLQKLVGLYANVGETNKVEPLITKAIKDFPDDSDMLRYIIQYREEMGDLAGTLEPAQRLVAIENSNVQNHLLLARAYYAQQKKKEFYDAAQEAVNMGGRSIQDALLDEPYFAPLRDEPEFKKLITSQPLLTP